MHDFDALKSATVNEVPVVLDCPVRLLPPGFVQAGDKFAGPCVRARRDVRDQFAYRSVDIMEWTCRGCCGAPGSCTRCRFSHLILLRAARTPS